MHRLKKLIHITLGSLLVLIGLAGLVLPILNGLLFLLLGFILLSFEIPLVEEKLAAFAKRNPLVEKWYLSLSEWMRKVFK